jgi:hypothetical protein
MDAGEAGMTARRVIFWLAALALGVLGWFAMMPIWTQGLGLCALDGDGQPGLWLAAAKVALVLWGATSLTGLNFITAKDKKDRRPVEAGRRASLVACVAGLVLLLAMAGQPLRSWFLGAHLVPLSSPGIVTVLIGLGFVATAADMLLGSRLPRVFWWMRLLVFLPAAASFGWGLFFLGLAAGSVLMGTIQSDQTTKEPLNQSGIGVLVFLFGSFYLIWSAFGHDGWTQGLIFVAVGWFLALDEARPGRGWLPGVQKGFVLAGFLACFAPVASGRLVVPTTQDWLVLAFALGCGIFAAGIRCCVLGAKTPADPAGK